MACGCLQSNSLISLSPFSLLTYLPIHFLSSSLPSICHMHDGNIKFWLIILEWALIARGARQSVLSLCGMFVSFAWSQLHFLTHCIGLLTSLHGLSRADLFWSTGMSQQADGTFGGPGTPQSPLLSPRMAHTQSPMMQQGQQSAAFQGSPDMNGWPQGNMGVNR